MLGAGENRAVEQIPCKKVPKLVIVVDQAGVPETDEMEDKNSFETDHQEKQSEPHEGGPSRWIGHAVESR